MPTKQQPPQRLRASAQPVNTMIRPEAPLLAPDAAQPTALLQLADSLRGLSPRLAQFGEAYRASTEQEGESEALGLRLRTTTEELTAQIDRGDIAPEVNRAALEMGHGEDIARRDTEELRQRYEGQSTATDGENNAFDRDQGNFDAWIASAAADKERAVPRTPATVHGYRKYMTDFQKQLHSEHVAYLEKRTKEANLDAAYKDLYGTAVGSVASGERDPAKIHGAMREAWSKTAKIHLLTPSETDEAMAVTANSLAMQGIPGNPQLAVDLVKEIYLGSRGDGSSPFGVPTRNELFPGEEKFFKENPHVAGMAAEDGAVILNPHSKLSTEERGAVALNEAARVYMRQSGTQPTFAITPNQKAAFRGTAYEGDEQAMRETIAARILSGDPSAGDVTDEQRKFVETKLENAKKRGGVPPLGASAKYADVAVKTIEQAEKTAGELQRKLNVTLKVDFSEAASTGTLKEKEFIAFTEANPHVFSQGEREGILIANRNALNTARDKQKEMNGKLALKAEAQASEQNVNVMLEQAGDAGTLLTIPEKVTYKKDNGETATYGRSELVDRAVENKLAALDAYAQSLEKEPGADPAQVAALKFDRELDYFKRNPVKNPQWANVLNAGYSSAAPDTLAGATQAPPHLLQAVKLYEDLEAKAPGVLRRHLADEAARDFYETYRTARTLLRQDERQAFHTAALATKGLQDEAQFQPAYDKVETELARSESIWPWAQGIENYGEMLPEVRRLGRVLVRAGASPTNALTRAGEIVRKQYTNINGYMLKTSDRNVESFGSNLAALKLQPREFKDVVLDYLGKYASDQHDASTLSIRPMSNGVGTWAVIDAVTGFPIESNSGLAPQFSIRELLDFEKAVQEGKIDEKLKELRKPARSFAPHNLIRRAFGFEDLDLEESAD